MILENIVYLELVKRGRTARVGKVGEKEVDFVAAAGDQRKFEELYQVMCNLVTSQ